MCFSDSAEWLASIGCEGSVSVYRSLNGEWTDNTQRVASAITIDKKVRVAWESGRACVCVTALITDPVGHVRGQ